MERRRKPPNEVEVLDLSERTQLTSSDNNQSDDESEYSTERTTDGENESDDESTDVGTDIGVAGPRSMSRSTIATSLAGAQSVSRSTVETTGSSLHDMDSGEFYAKDSESSLPKTAEDSGQSEKALASAEAIKATSTIDFEDSSSSERSSEYDSSSPDEYYSSSESIDASKTGVINSEGWEEEVVASLMLQGQSENDPDAIETTSAAMGIRDHDSDGLETNDSATFAESGLTESGDTFLAMEEAAHAENPDEVAVTKTRFTLPSLNANPDTEKTEARSSVSPGVVAATVGAGVLGVAAVAAISRDKLESGSDNSEYSVESSSPSDDSDSSSYTSSSSDTSGSDTGSESNSSESNDDGNDNVDRTSEFSQTDVKPAANVSRSKPIMLPKIVEENVGEPSLRNQLRPTKSEGAISRKPNASPGPGAELNY